MGCYPLFACRDWPQLARDLAALEAETELISLTVVTDPFGDYELSDLRHAFRDLARPYKEHFVVDLSQPVSRTACAHHRRNARQALAVMEIERCEPAAALDEWLMLYQHLIRRHAIQGLAAFSPASFAPTIASAWHHRFPAPGIRVKRSA